MRRLLIFLTLFLGLRLFAAEVMPPVPALYFNDYANVTSADTADRLNQTLADFERESSSQIVVAVFPKMQSDSSIQDYTVRIAREWKVGQKDKDNGAVLFVFIQDRKMYLQVGYGLEGVLPDATCKRIIEDEIKPHFKSSDYNGGLTAGVRAILAAAKGEYKGTRSTVAESRGYRGGPSDPSLPVILIAVVIISIILLLAVKGRVGRGGGGWIITSGGGGGWFSGGGGGGGGGGFSGGGGSFGGGGAGGSW